MKMMKNYLRKKMRNLMMMKQFSITNHKKPQFQLLKLNNSQLLNKPLQLLLPNKHQSKP